MQVGWEATALIVAFLVLWIRVYADNDEAAELAAAMMVNEGEKEWSGD